MSKTNSPAEERKKVESKPNLNSPNSMDRNFQKLLDIHDFPVLLVDKKNGNIIAVNKSTVNLCGCTRQSLINKNFTRLFTRHNGKLSKTSEYQFNKNGNSAIINFKQESLKLNEINFYLYKSAYEPISPDKTEKRKSKIKPGTSLDEENCLKVEKSTAAELIASEKRYRNLFEDSPFSMWEEDMSAIKNALDMLTLSGTKEICNYLNDNPDYVKTLISKVKIVNVNKATLNLYKAKSKSQVKNGLSKILSDESLEVFKLGICALYEGDAYFEGESINYTLDGDRIYISLRSSVVTGYENDWKKVLISITDITEKHQSEEALKESEDKFRKIAEKSLISMYLIQDGKFKYVNPKFAEIFHYERDEIVNKLGPADLTADVHQETVKNNIYKRLSGELDSINYEFNGLTKNKDIIKIEVFGSRITYMGKPAIAGTLLDVTGRKKWEDDLQESQRRYKELTDLLPQTIFEINLEGRIQFVNQAGLKAFNYTADTLNSGPIIYDFLIPKDRGRAAANMLKVLKGEKSGETEYTAVRKNGITFPILVFSNPIMRNGKAVGIRGIVVDMSERKLIEEQLRKLSRAVEQSPSSIVITDLFGEIEYVNPRFTQLTGYHLSEVIGKNPRILKSGETPGKIYSDLWTTVTRGNTWRGEFHNKKKNGDLYWEYASISPIVDHDGKISHFLAIKDDITEKKSIENELLRAKEKAEESDRLKSEFLAQMSHEIRSPLNVILNYNTFLKEELSSLLNDEQVIAISSIETAGKRLLRTIDLILNMAALQSGYFDLNPVDIDLTLILEELIKEYKQNAQKKKLKFTFTNKVKNSKVKGDDYIITEIFENLIGNAIKYTSQGNIDVILYENPEKKLCVDVKDTGIGISDEYLPKLFIPFSQEETGYSRRFEGNGLGLALVKKYSELLNARIKVESTKGIGTKFTVTFKRNTDI